MFFGLFSHPMVAFDDYLNDSPYACHNFKRSHRVDFVGFGGHQSRVHSSPFAKGQIIEKYRNGQEPFQRVVAAALDNWLLPHSGPLPSARTAGYGPKRSAVVTHRAGTKAIRFCRFGICRLRGVRPMSPGDIQLLPANGDGTVHDQRYSGMAEQPRGIWLHR